MDPVLCLFGGCNGAGKTTLARELLPLMKIRRFLNADEIARGLSPMGPESSAFRAGRILHDEALNLLAAQASFGLESTLSGRTHLGLMQKARAAGYRIVLHYILLDSADRAVERVRLRVRHGGHAVTDHDVRRRFLRSRRQFLAEYLPLADDWTVWDNTCPPPQLVADNATHQPSDLAAGFEASCIRETPEGMSEPSRLGWEAGQRATARMLDFYRRMGLAVTPQMTFDDNAEANAADPQVMALATGALYQSAAPDRLRP